MLFKIHQIAGVLVSRASWTRDEILLTLEKYFELDIGRVRSKDPEIIELSHLLTHVIIMTSGDDTLFRSPDAVKMKLMNFRALDPTYSGVGLPNIAKQDRSIWEEFCHDQERLKEITGAIRVALEASDKGVGPNFLPVFNDEIFPEGKILTRCHRLRERNVKAIAAKKSAVLQQTGKLACEVCGFDFHAKYGELGSGFIECHHIIPLSKLAECSETKLSDLAVVCANCHRMLHRLDKVHSISQLKELMKAKVC